MAKYPKSIQDLIDEFSKLPTIGPKTAERLVLYLVNRPSDELKKINLAMANLKNKVYQCNICQNVSDSNPCSICQDSKRNHSVICIVAKPQDVIAIEKTNEFSGVYFVLNISNIEDSIKEENYVKLIARIKNDNINEIILALNPDIEGETISLSLIKLLKAYNLKVTRLARGLPMGADLEYADEVTLSNALKGRREI